MKEIKKEDVIAIAKLAKLSLKQEEIELFSKQFADIVSFIEKLNEVDTGDIKPFYELTTTESFMREDIPHISLSNEEALKNAPDKEGGFFKVPRIVGES